MANFNKFEMFIFLFIFRSFSIFIDCNLSLGSTLINFSNDNSYYELICNDNQIYNFSSNDIITIAGSTDENFIKIFIDDPNILNHEIKIIFNNLFINLTDKIPLEIDGNVVISIIEMIGDNQFISLKEDSIFISENSELFLNKGSISLSSPKSLIGGNSSNVYINSVTLNPKPIENSIEFGIISQRISIIDSNISMQTQYDTIGGNYCTSITIENSHIYSKSEKGSSIGKSGKSISSKKSDGENYDPIDLYIFNSTIESHSNNGPAIGQQSELGSLQITQSHVSASSFGYFSAVGGCKSVNILSSAVYASSYHGAPIGGPGIETLYNTITTNITNSSVEAYALHEGTEMNTEASAIGGGKSDICHIYIRFSSVVAMSEGTGAAIGGGNFGVRPIIEISDSEVWAKATSYTSPGIGGGNAADFDYIRIVRSNVTAYSGLSAAAIGACIMYSGNFIWIEDSIINAFSDEFGAAIGGARSTTDPLNITIINSSVYAVAGGQRPSTIPQGAAIGGGCQSTSTETMLFGNLYAFDSNITAVSGGYGSAIGGGYNQGIGEIIFINCQVVAVSDLNRSASLFPMKKVIPFENNPGAGIGTGGSQYYPPGSRVSNANGNITFINCSFIDVYGGSVEKHSNTVSHSESSKSVNWHAASGIGLGGIRPHTIEDSNLSISFINCNNVSIYGGSGFDDYTFPGAAIGGSSLDFNTAFKFLNVENSSIYLKNGRSLIKGQKHAAVGFPSSMNDYGEVSIKKSTEFIVDSSDDFDSIAFSVNKLSVEKSCEIVIHSKIEKFINVIDLNLSHVPIVVFKKISSLFNQNEKIISIEFNRRENNYAKIVDVKNYDDLLFITLAEEGFYSIYVNTVVNEKSKSTNLYYKKYILGDSLSSSFKITSGEETVFIFNEVTLTDFSIPAQTSKQTEEIIETKKPSETFIKTLNPSENDDNKRNQRISIIVIAVSVSVFIITVIVVIVVLFILFRDKCKFNRNVANTEEIEREMEFISNHDNGNGNVPEHNI